MKKRKGITLIELIVALGILSVILAMGIAFLRTQLSTSSKQEKLANIQTDIQTALTIIKWDLMMGGYGIPISVTPITGQNNADAGRDRLTINATDLSIGGSSKWSFTVDISSGNVIHVRRWGKNDIEVGDRIVILSDTKKPVGPVATVTNRESETDIYGQPAYALTIDQNVSTAQGNFVYVVPTGGYLTANYYYNNGNLMRNNDVLLNNTEDFQVAYWVDLNGNNLQDAGEWVHDLSALSAQQVLDGLKNVRISIIEVTPPDPSYTYPDNQVTLEDHSYNLSGDDLHRRRRVYTLIAKVRNMR